MLVSQFLISQFSISQFPFNQHRMSKTRKAIVQDLLKEANYYWHDDQEDQVQPLNPDDFDPIVDKIFKANALELEKLYAEIEESQREIIVGLSKALVPNESLLPVPGYTVAQIKPKVSRVFTSPEDKYVVSGQSDTGEKYEYYFTPLFEHNYPKCEVAAILTENVAMQVTGNVPEIVGSIPGGKETSHIWLGLNIGKIEEQDIISFYLGNGIIDTFNKDYTVFHNAKWLLNGEAENELSVQTGIAGFIPKIKKGNNGNLLDSLYIPNSHEKQILSRLRNSFIILTVPPELEEAKNLAPPSLAVSELIAHLDIKEPLVWVKLEFSLAIPNEFFLHNILYPNTIPLVNRRLIEKYVVKSNYERILLPMPTKDLFLALHKVQDTKNREDDPETTYERVEFLQPNSRPGSFMLRSGSRVRRLNREDASRQIYRLLEVIREEYSTFKEEGVDRLKEDFNVIEKAINRIKRQLPEYFRENEAKSSYFGIADFRPKVSRLYYQYWETQGDAIVHLSDKIGLAVASSDRNIANSISIIPIQKGKGELTSDDFINQLKISLLSRGRIMTRGDVELYCQSRYGHLLKVDSVTTKLMMLEDGKTGRGVLVTIVWKKDLPAATAEFIRLELQNDLNAKSAFFTQIKVEAKHGR